MAFSSDSSSRTIFYFAKVTCKAGTFSLSRAVSFICIEDTRGHPSWWLNQQGSSLPQSAPKLIRCITNHISLSSKLQSTLGYLRGYLYFPTGIFPRRKTACNPAGAGNDPDLSFLSPSKAKYLISLPGKNYIKYQASIGRLARQVRLVLFKFERECPQSFAKPIIKGKNRGNLIEFLVYPRIKLLS